MTGHVCDNCGRAVVLRDFSAAQDLSEVAWGHPDAILGHAWYSCLILEPSASAGWFATVNGHGTYVSSNK